MKKLYVDMTQINTCTSVFVRDAEVIPAGAIVYSMSPRHRNAEYERYGKDYDIHFIFDDEVLEINFFTVPRVDIFATDSCGGYLGTVGGMPDMDGREPVCYIDNEKKCYLVADDMKSFFKDLESTANWQKNRKEYDGIRLYSSKEEAKKELEFLA